MFPKISESGSRDVALALFLRFNVRKDDADAQALDRNLDCILVAGGLHMLRAFWSRRNGLEAPPQKK